MNRRDFLTSSLAVSACAVVPRSFADWQPSQRYPDPAIKVIDPSFGKYRLPLAKVEKIASGMRWCEGPVWFGDGRYLLWSDIPNNRIMRWDEETGAVSVFRKPSNNSNGNTRDRQGRLLTCEHDARRVTRTEYDGSITVIADRLTANRSTRRTISCANRMARFGSRIRRLASWEITRATSQRRNYRPTSTAGIRNRNRSPSSRVT